MRAGMGTLAVLAALVVAAEPAPARPTVYSSLPLQGDSGPQSKDIVRAMRMALAEAGSPVRYVSLDDASGRTGFWDPARVKANASRAADDPHAVAYLGEFNSPASEFSIPILNRAGILQVSPSNTSAGLTRPRGGEPGEPGRYYPAGTRTYGRVVPADHIQAAALSRLMRERRCEEAYVVASDEPYGTGLARRFAHAARRDGIAVVRGPRVDPDFEAVRAIGRKVRRSGADCFLFSGITFFRAPEVVNAVGRAVPSIRVFGPDGLAEAAFGEQLDSAIRKRVLLTNPTLAPRAYPAAGRRFLRRFERRYGRAPEPYAIYGYEAMAVTLDAIERAGGPQARRRAVVRSFFRTERRRSVLGRYAIDRYGDTTLRRYGVYRLRGPEVVFVRAVEIRRSRSR